MNSLLSNQPSPPKPSLRLKSLLRIALWLVNDPEDFDQLAYPPARNYQVPVPGQSPIFLCGGRLRAHSRPYVPLLTALVIVCPAIVYFITTASLVWHRVHPSLVLISAYTFFLTIANFTWALLCDPGVCPRNVHLPSRVDPRRPCIRLPREYTEVILLPHQSGYGVTVRFCPVCQIWRPPRTAHCYTCNVCCNAHDHHCVWLGNCVGARNYSYFLYFLAATTTTCMLFGVLLVLALLRGPETLKQEAKHHPGTVFVAVYVFAASVQPLLLWILHTWLTLNNLTTREFLNNVIFSDEKYQNPFNTRNALKNAYLFWCGRVRGSQLIKSRAAYVTGHAHFLSLQVITEASESQGQAAGS